MCFQFNLYIFICVFVCCVYVKCNAIPGLPVKWSVMVLKYPIEDPALTKIKELKVNEKDMRELHVWPSGVIPYYIDDLSFDKAIKDSIRLYLDNVNRVTGILFVEILRPPEDENSRWVFFINRRGQLNCADLAFHNFTNEGVQKVVLGYDCLADGKMGAIVLSLIGVPPQHNAPNRNDYIEVNEKNILPDKLYLFNKLKNEEWLFSDLQYDYYSAGHYDPYQYTSNGGETITYKPRSGKEKKLTPGPSMGFTSTDLSKIYALYKNIIRQRDTSFQVPGCKKLFGPGPKLNNEEDNSDNEDEIDNETEKQPTNENEEDNFDNEDQNENKTEKQHTNENEDDNFDNEDQNKNKTEKQMSNENKSSIETNADNDDNKVKIDQDDDNMHISVTNQNINKSINIYFDEELRQKKLLSYLNKKEKLLNESDYETGEEDNKNL